MLMAKSLCTCDSICPDAGDCTCIEIFQRTGHHLCNCDCTPFTVLLEAPKAEDRVNLNVRNKEVGAVAEFVHRMTGTDVLIPASALRKRVTMSLQDVTFADALRELGLAIAPSEDTGPDYPAR